MFGFGGGFNGPGGGSTNSGSAPSGGAGGKAAEKSGRVGSSTSNAGREGTTSGPGNPGHTASTSGNAGHEGVGGGPGGPAGTGTNSGTNAGSNAGREGQRAGPGNPGAGGGMAEKGDRVGGGYSVGNVDPARFGGSTPTGFSPDIDPARFGGSISTEKGDRLGFGAAMGATTAETERAAQARAAERTSMDTYDAAARTREDNARMADLAATRRAAEDRSMATYDAATKLSDANALRADTASSIRTAENTSMGDMASWGKQVKSVREAGPGWTSVELNDGTVERRAGDRAARNNNPGNIMAGPFADSMGAIGNDFATPADIAAGRKRGFAVFGTKADGLKAQAGWFAKEAKNNPNMTLGQAISKYAPAFENNTKAYTAALAAAGGITANTKVSEINPSQMESMLAAQLGVEGNTGFKMAEVSPRTKDYGDVRSYPDTATQFASTYLGKDPRAKEKDYFGSVPDNQWPGNLEVAQRNGIPAESGDTAAPQQADYTPDPSLTEFPDRPRSNFEKVAAAGLDIGAGLLPGVGLGVGLLNGGLQLTGSRTIGTRIVDAIATGDGKYTPGAPGDPNREYQVADSTIPAAAPHTTVPTVESFVDSYLSPPDKTKYPTPYERYDLNRNTYAGV